MNNNYKRKKDPVENRRLILETVIELADNLELSQISFDALAKKCGLSKGGIIHHFHTKEAIFDTLFQETFDEYRGWVEKEMRSTNISNPSVAFLKVNMRCRDDQNYKKLMKVIFKCLANNDDYCQQWNKWFSHDIVGGLNEDDEVNVLLGSLIAVGFWTMDTLGLYALNQKKMEKILNTLHK
ncbi:hypothetical protein AM493_06555 [Flavobacterium akiainvivens]|uniref:HTH tetR-type domain-containing protein n=1 Tax=Flavobacterium akiainvivens TaxID=1202724 RepID=A0A0M9VHM7_9FLAO|nr:TetR/AcrR family transcriptional regulator [Flavobacterium akiainvivens]KOS05736.1 hypothetical protein AM493_06555 [Flavobacterium akiainvivens]SFQ37602.1 transcriptional regulator, TetR family [Flavobacterium akiainvivens]